MICIYRLQERKNVMYKIMSYYIDIIDTTSPLVKLKIELASGGGIELRWNGADKKRRFKYCN
jgi:hypothetical protein